MCNEILLVYYYNLSDIIQFKEQYLSENMIVGVSVYETFDFGTLYNIDNNDNSANIQFNNFNRKYITYPSIYKITENIQIQMDDDTSISLINYYKSNTGYYPPGTKYILPIISKLLNYNI